jgi:hypothetical protein
MDGRVDKESSPDVSYLPDGGQTAPAAGQDDPALLHVLVTASPVVMFVADARFGRLQYVSANALHVLGYSAEEMLSTPGWWQAHVRAEDYARMVERFQLARARRSNQVISEMRLRRLDGAEMWLDLIANLEYDAAGEPTRVLGYCVDISRRKAAEEGLREAEARYRGIFEHAPAGIFPTTVDGHFISANPAAARITGFDSPEEMLRDGSLVAERYEDPADRNGFLRMVEEHDAVHGFESRIRRRDGELRWIALDARAVRDAAGRMTGIDGIAVDITDRKRAERTLRESEARFRTLVEQIPAITYVLSGENAATPIYFSPQIESILGIPAAEAVAESETWIRHLHEDDRAWVLSALHASRAAGRPFIAQYRMVARDGHTVWIHDEGRLLNSRAGQPPVVQGVMLDITERMRAQQRERTQVAVTRALAASTTLRDAAARVPRTICEGFGWDVGEIWWAEPASDRLRWNDGWHTPGLELDDFVAASRTMTLGRGEGLPGRAWESDEPFWSADVASDPSNPRAAAAATAGLHAGFSIPVRRGGEVLGVMNFLSRHVQQEDADLLATMADIGMQINQFVERQLLAVRLRTSEQRLTRIIETMADGIVLMDADGRFIVTNAAAEQIVGVSRDAYLGLHAQEAPWRRAGLDGSPLTGIGHPFILARDANAPVRDVRFVVERPDGSRLTVSVNAAPLHDADGAFAGVIATFHDITELQAAQIAALEASRAKSEFLSRMSHELRTPLNAILGFAQLMEMEEMTAEQAESVDHILGAGRHLLDLINEVLDITRIEAGGLALSIEPVQLGETLSEVIDLVRPLAQQSTVAVQSRLPAACDVYVLADRQRLKQVLLNLLVNAVKYNRVRGSVSFLGTISSDQPPSLRLTVRDTGPGISPDGLQRLFTPFERLGAEQSGIEGTGLGLSLSQRLMVAMGGRIGVESNPGEGSSFWIELPLATTVADQAPPAWTPREGDPAARPDQPARTVLYIEDNLSNYRLIERALANWPGVRLISAIQGSLGVELAREHRPDLILLDVHLPDISGEEVLRRLRRDPATHDIPTLAISADATAGQIDRLLTAGASDYLTKPLDLSRFLTMVDELLAWERTDRAP